MYVYRDDTAPPADTGAKGAKSTPRPPAEDDTSYWYDLLAEDPAPQPEEYRGPFEPLSSSAGTPDAAGQAGTEQGPDPAREAEPPEQARARKLEQLRDLYLTAEAIGEQNVDKHFDHLLARQRELISDYFRQPAGADPTGRQMPDTPETPQRPQASVRPETPVRPEPPRAW